MEPHPRLPDFFVVGGQKCGSTDLCARLAAHPDVFFARPKELYFFCRDDLDVLPYPFFERFEEWEAFDWAEDRDRLLAGYGRHFADAAEAQLCGEGTPFYLPSELALERIATTCPDARIVVILRNPVDRAYSAYWHHVKMRRSTETFENHLRFESGGTLRFGRYEEQLRRWFDRFGRDRVQVLLFEDYVKDRLGVANDVFSFLGLSPLEAEPPQARKQNKALVPRSPRVARWLNRATRLYDAHHGTIEYERQPPRRLGELAVSKVVRGLGRANLGSHRYPPMAADTRRRLDAYYRRANRGLAELLGRDLRAWGW